jgi:hypothetical protein
MTCVKTLVAGYMLCTTPYGQVIEPDYIGHVVLEGNPKQAAYVGALHQLSTTHKGLWHLTDAQLDQAFADYGPRRHLEIDWPKVNGYKP